METAFDILVAQYRPMLISYARTLLGGDRHEAEDVVQESFLVAHRRLADFREGEDFARWLRGIARHKVLESRRSARQRRAVVDARIIEGIDEVYSMFDLPVASEGHGEEHSDEHREEPWQGRLARLLQQCVGQLSSHLHDSIIRVYREGLSLREAAAALNSSSAAVAQRLSRARELIRKCVAERMEADA